MKLLKRKRNEQAKNKNPFASSSSSFFIKRQDKSRVFYMKKGFKPSVAIVIVAIIVILVYFILFPSTIN